MLVRVHLERCIRKLLTTPYWEMDKLISCCQNLSPLRWEWRLICRLALYIISIQWTLVKHSIYIFLYRSKFLYDFSFKSNMFWQETTSYHRIGMEGIYLPIYILIYPRAKPFKHNNTRIHIIIKQIIIPQSIENFRLTVIIDFFHQFYTSILTHYVHLCFFVSSQLTRVYNMPYIQECFIWDWDCNKIVKYMWMQNIEAL